MHDIERLLPRLDVIESRFDGPRFGGAHQMRVRVDEPGNHGLAAEIDSASVRPGEPRDVLIAADRYKAVASNRDCLRDAEPIVDGDDLAVSQNDVGRRLLRAKR